MALTIYLLVVVLFFNLNHRQIFISSLSNNTSLSSPTDLRLPKTIVPVDYDFHLIPDHLNYTFQGEIVITVLVSSSTNLIKLHANELQIKTIEVIDLSTNNSLTINKFYLETKKQLLVIDVKETLQLNQRYLIKINYSGIIDKESGYFGKSVQVRNKTCRISATKLQRTYARNVLPCFDEPNFKATIKLRITHESDLIALANMPEERVLRNGNKTTTTFIRSTVRMSTYLFSWAVGCFEMIQQSTSRGLNIRFFALPHKLPLTPYFLDIGVKMLDFYESYFQIPFPLPKLDIVAVPEYPTGGMENWGLIGLFDKILYDPVKSDSFYIKKEAAKLLSHELAHNWFGNLVTMDWWDDIWLNEGFTSHMEYKGLSVVHPDWELDQHFIIDRFQKAMELDSTPSSHSVIQFIDDPNNIKKIYLISYSKGSCVVRMLENFIGEEKFRKAIRNYVMRFKESNAKSSELWTEVNAVIKDGVLGIKNISYLMDKWINDKNFPVVNVLKTNNSLTLKQARFVTQQTSTETLDQRPWIIPINIITQNGIKTMLLLDEHEKTFQLRITENEWIKLNHQQMGYFIVNYTAEDWHRLTLQLKNNHQVLSSSDRANLLFDCFIMVNASKLSYSILFNLLDYLKNENHFIPWFTAYHNIFTTLIKQLPSDKNWCLRKYLKDLSINIYQKISWDLESYEMNLLNQRNLRQFILLIACGNDNEDCLKQANRYLMKHLNGEEVNPDLRFEIRNHPGQIIYVHGMKLTKDLSEWKKVFDRFKSEPDIEEKGRLLKAMAGVRDEKLLRTVIVYAFGDNNTVAINKSESFDLLQAIVNGNEVEREVVWSAIKNQATIFYNRFKNTTDNVTKILEKIIENSNEKQQVEEMESLLGKHPYFGAELKKLLEKQKEKILNQKQNKNAFEKWLEETTGLGQLCKDWLISHPSGLKSTWKCCTD